MPIQRCFTWNMHIQNRTCKTKILHLKLHSKKKSEPSEQKHCECYLHSVLLWSSSLKYWCHGSHENSLVSRYPKSIYGQFQYSLVIIYWELFDYLLVCDHWENTPITLRDIVYRLLTFKILVYFPCSISCFVKLICFSKDYWNSEKQCIHPTLYCVIAILFTLLDQQ